MKKKKLLLPGLVIKSQKWLFTAMLFEQFMAQIETFGFYLASGEVWARSMNIFNVPFSFCYNVIGLNKISFFKFFYEFLSLWF